MRARLRNFTPAQIKKLSNGCGSKGSPVEVPQFIFHASCDKHDVLYTIGGSPKDRKLADKAFYRFMIKDTKAEKLWYKRLYYRIWAYVYYRSVRMFGYKFFAFSAKGKSYKEMIKLIS